MICHIDVILLKVMLQDTEMVDLEIFCIKWNSYEPFWQNLFFCKSKIFRATQRVSVLLLHVSNLYEGIQQSVRPNNSQS